MNSRAYGSQGGFTLLEITVVMGLLFVFMTYLTNILFNVTEVFSQARKSQELTQRMVAAWQPLDECLGDLAGPTQQSDRGADARFVVQWASEGLVEGANKIQVLRSTVRIAPEIEEALIRRKTERGFVAEHGEFENLEEEPLFRQALQQEMRRRGRRGRAEMLLVTWPQGDPEGAFLELRRGLFLPDEPLPFKEAEGLSLMEVHHLGLPHFPVQRVLEETEILASGLLHLEFRFESQNTTDWNQEPDAGGPEWVWDSARAGWLLEAKSARERFTLDLGATSLRDGTDDVYPCWVEYRLVVGSRAAGLPDAILAEPLSEDQKQVRLMNTDALPDAASIHDHMLKIGGEWVRFGGIRGRTLTGLVRGLRGTKAREHPLGTGVRAGSTRVLRFPLLHGREYRNG